jgi:hypothetical protein
LLIDSFGTTDGAVVIFIALHPLRIEPARRSSPSEWLLSY